MSNHKKIKSEFYIVFEVKKGGYRNTVSPIRMTKSKPKKIGARQFFAKMCIQIPNDYIDKPSPTVDLDFDKEDLGSQSTLLAEKLKGNNL